MRYIYYYYAVCTSSADRGLGKGFAIDGILNRSTPLLTMADYHESKKEIKSLVPRYYDMIVVHSLSFLHTKEEE